MSGVLTAFSSGEAGVINPSLPNAAAFPSAEWRLNNDGTYTISGESAGNWVTPASAPIAALFQVKTDVTAGTFDTDPSAGSYLDLSSSRSWVKSSVGTVTFTVTIREKASLQVRSVQAGKTATLL